MAESPSVVNPETVNTVSKEAERGEAYEVFKKYKAELLIDLVQEKFPEALNLLW